MIKKPRKFMKNFRDLEYFMFFKTFINKTAFFRQYFDGVLIYGTSKTFGRIEQVKGQKDNC